jgi:MFS family permease
LAASTPKSAEAVNSGLICPIRWPFAVASTAAFVDWAVAALFLTLVPTYTTSVLHTHNLAALGGVVFLMLGTSALAQMSLQSLAPRRALGIGLAVLAVGLDSVVLAKPMQLIGLLLTGTVLTGLGQGLSFMGGLALINHIAPADKRAEVTSAFYVAIYIGVALPVLGVGFGAGAIGLFTAVVIFAAIIGVLALLTALFVARQGRLVEARNADT